MSWLYTAGAFWGGILGKTNVFIEIMVKVNK